MHPYFKKRFSPIALIILVFFSWFSIEPWNYAVWAQDLPDSQDNLPLSNTASKRFEESLRSIKKIIGDLDKQITSGKDITRALERLKDYKNDLKKADPDIKDDFAREEAYLKGLGLPSLILDRHKKAVTYYNTNYKTLEENLDSIIRLEAERKRAKSKKDKDLAQRKLKSLKAKIKVTKDELKTKAKEPRHTPFKPSAPTNRSRKLKPVKTSWLKQIGDLLIPSAYAVEPPGPSDLAGTDEAPLSQEVIDLANQLGGSPVNIYEFVRNNFKYEPYAGSLKGAIQTLREKGGNEWDQASLLIALYRASGIHARYVVGTVEIPIDKAMSWLGVEDQNMAGSLLATLGRPTTTIVSGGKITAIQTQQVWVQAYVPFLNSRGAVPGSGDTWVDIDPSFKGQTKTQTLSIAGVPLFDQAGYLSTLRPESPQDLYLTQLQGFLDINSPGHVPRALARNLDISLEFLGILVGQPPYTIKSITATYTEIPDSYKQKFTLEIRDPLIGEVQMTYTASITKIIGKRLTLSYVPATAQDQATITAYGGLYSTPPYLIMLKPELKLEGVTVAQGVSVGSGTEQQLALIFDNTLNTEQVENIIIAGEYYAVALNAYMGSDTHEEILERSKRLSAINDTINLNDPATLDDRLGELLHLSAMLYHQNYNQAIRKIAPLNQVIDVRDVSEIIYLLTVNVDYIFGVPKRITPVGITADLDRDTHLVIPVDGDLSRRKPYMQLVSSQSSYLEHSVTEKVYKTDAISAVKGIQMAHDLGIPVHTITKQNISTILPLLQLSSDLESEIENAVNSGQEVIVPERNLTYFDWTGVGYIIYDPQDGDGAYRISGGFGGAVAVHKAYLDDLLVTLEPEFALRTRDGALRPKLCFPGIDNLIDYKEDTCYTVVTIEEACEGETDEAACGNLYSYGTSESGGNRISHDFFARPLIDIFEFGSPDPSDPTHSTALNRSLTKNITARDWQSQDDARYMRAGYAILAVIESLMKSLKATKHNLRPVGAGYRTKTRNRSVGGSSGSHHMDGVAADYRLEISDSERVDKCLILWSVDFLIGGKGEVLSERKDGISKTTVHSAIPGINNRDMQDHAQWKTPLCN